MRRPTRLAATLLLLASALAVPGTAQDTAGEAALAKAAAALARGDGIGAEVELKKAQAAGVPRDRLASRMGEALIIQRNYAAARAWLAGGQFAKGDEAYGWRMLGMLERFTGNLEAAGQACQRALAAAPRDPLVWTEIGRVRFGKGEQIQAIDAANRALEVDPDNPRALELRAQLLREQAGWDAALPLYERALIKAPADLSLLAGYASTLGEAGRTREMLTVTRRMIELDARDPRAWFYQAVLAARAGKADLARRLLVKAGRGGATPAATLLRGVLELEAGYANMAVAQFDALIRQQPANPVVQGLLARALYEAGDTDALLLRFTALAGRPDASPYLLAIMGRALEERGDRAGAAFYLDRLAKAQPLPVMPIGERGSDDVAASVRAMIAAGKFVGAAGAADAYAAQRPGMFEALSLAGDAALARGAPLPALDYYRRAAQVRHPERMLLRAVEALEKSGRGREAPALVLGYLTARPGSPLAARLAAGHAAYSGQWAQSRSLLEHLVWSRGGARDARLLVDLSLAQLNTGDAEAARDSAQRAARLMPASGFAAQAWGLALVELEEDPDLARQLLDKARRIDGDNPLLAAARKRLGK